WRRFLSSGQRGRKECRLLPGNFVHRAISKRDYEHISVWCGFDVGSNSEVAANQKTLTFRDVEFVEVVSDQIVQTRISERIMQTIGCELEAKQKTAVKKSTRRANEHIAFELRAYAAPINKSERRSGNGILPTEFRFVIVSPGQHVQACDRGTGSVGDVRRGPAQLL